MKPRVGQSLALLAVLLPLASAGCGDESSSDYGAEAHFCAELINDYRFSAGLEPLTRSPALEGCAAEAAMDDARTGQFHGYFIRTRGCSGTATAENEIPGQALGSDGSIDSVIESGTAAMWAEGPGGGHHDNIAGDFTAVGCGIFVTSSRNVWVVQDFK